MYKADYHIHTRFSDDSTTPMEEQVKRAIALGFNEIAITDHNEHDHINPEYVLPLNMQDYIQQLNEMKAKYKNQIKLKLGIELGYETRGKDVLSKYVTSYPFDFVICSLHSLDNEDFYFGNYFEGKTKQEAYERYFKEIQKCVNEFDDFNVIGHLDFICRYGHYEDKTLHYDDYREYVDSILKKLIDKSKGIELNTSGIRYQLGHMHPQVEFLKRYKQLGGQIITIGSDAHRPQDVGADYEVARKMLTEIGFQYFTTFTKCKPEFHRL